MMKVDILYITYNRIQTTMLTLPTLLESTEYPFALTIVDNGSEDGTQEYLKQTVDNQRRSDKITLIMNHTNQGLSGPTNEFWKKSQAELVGKIDNDILVENAWLERLVNTHITIPNVAVVGGFHFPLEVFNYEKCKHNIHQYNDIKILRQPHIGGNYLAKRLILLENGLLEEPGAGDFKLGGWTGYQQRLTKNGYIIGYYYPLIYFEHLHLAPNRYYKKVRKMTKKEYLHWERTAGEEMIYTKWSWD